MTFLVEQRGKFMPVMNPFTWSFLVYTDMSLPLPYKVFHYQCGLFAPWWGSFSLLTSRSGEGTGVVCAGSENNKQIRFYVLQLHLLCIRICHYQTENLKIFRGKGLSFSQKIFEFPQNPL